LTKISKTLKVLYVEDNEESRHFTLKMLNEYFEDITIAIDGADGLEKFKNGNFNVVFTDLDMPVMDGISMLEAIRRFDSFTPIVILSGHDDKEYFLQTIQAGIDGYILKPYCFEQVSDTVVKIILKLGLDIKTSSTIRLNYDFQWNKSEERLYKNKTLVKLTKNEIKLFKYFIVNLNKNLTSIDIDNFLYADEVTSDTRVRNMLSRLKNKLEVPLIESNYGYGYVLRMRSE